MRVITKKDATTLTTYPQNNTALTELSTLAHTHIHTNGHLRTSSFRTKPLPELCHSQQNKHATAVTPLL